MSPLPENMVDRWRNRREDGPEEGTVYWHILLGGNARVREVAKDAHDRLSEFSGLHMAPLQWLHITTLVVGPSNSITPSHMTEMLATAGALLSGMGQINVTIGRILYHPEAIVLGVNPKDALTPLRQAALTATRTATGRDDLTPDQIQSWMPHVTLCYSTACQPTEPIISALGLEFPGANIKVDGLSLVVQRGPERLWDWHRVGTIQLTDNRPSSLVAPQS